MNGADKTDDGVKLSDILEGAKAYEQFLLNMTDGDAVGEDLARRSYEKHCKRIEFDLYEYWGEDMSQEQVRGRAAGLIEGFLVGFYEGLESKDLL